LKGLIAMTRLATTRQTIASIAVLVIALSAYGMSSACRPVLGGSEDVGEQETAVTPRFELRLASNLPVEGWEKRVIAGPDVEIYIAPETRITNSDIAQAWFQPRGEEFVIGLLLTEEGALRLARLSGENIGGMIAILIDDKVVSAPRIMGRISDRAEIHGNFTEQEARDLASALDPTPED